MLPRRDGHILGVNWVDTAGKLGSDKNTEPQMPNFCSGRFGTVNSCPATGVQNPVLALKNILPKIKARSGGRLITNECRTLGKAFSKLDRCADC